LRDSQRQIARDCFPIDYWVLVSLFLLFSSVITIVQQRDQLPKPYDLPSHHLEPEVPFSIATAEHLHLPSIYTLLPYMHLDADSTLNPAFRIAPKADSRRLVRFVFGIPTVKRTIESYLVATLQNLIRNLSPAERSQACFVVLVAEVIYLFSCFPFN